MLPILILAILAAQSTALIDFPQLPAVYRSDVYNNQICANMCCMRAAVNQDPTTNPKCSNDWTQCAALDSDADKLIPCHQDNKIRCSVWVPCNQNNYSNYYTGWGVMFGISVLAIGASFYVDSPILTVSFVFAVIIYSVSLIAVSNYEHWNAATQVSSGTVANYIMIRDSLYTSLQDGKDYISKYQSIVLLLKIQIFGMWALYILRTLICIISRLKILTSSWYTSFQTQMIFQTLAHIVCLIISFVAIVTLYPSHKGDTMDSLVTDGQKDKVTIKAAAAILVVYNVFIAYVGSLILAKRNETTKITQETQPTTGISSTLFHDVHKSDFIHFSAIRTKEPV